MTPHPATLPIDQLLEACDVQHTRRSGPGGQHRNKVQTAVVVTHRDTGVRAEASERRSQARNQSAAVERLRIQLALKVRADATGSPSDLMRSRVDGGRITISPHHEDFPAILAEAMDLVVAGDLDPKAAAGVLGVTPSQLIKLLKLEPRAIEQLNLQRQAAGLTSLR